MTVTAPHGRVRGERSEQVDVFRGIRHARPPVGARRLRAARLAPPTSDVEIDATRFGPAAPQQVPFYLCDVTELDEDCLSLNIWRPRHRDPDLPVLVWVHGGGFKAGATSGRVHDGATLACEGLVVVTVNYRVGALGFGPFAHRGGRLAEATNLGLGDVICALQWIQRNIASFGGDPDRVCVAGQSAGAFLAGALLSAPTAAGLFRRLVPMSGGPYKIIDPATAETMGEHLLAAVGLGDDPTDADVAAIPIESWVAAADQVTAGDVGDRNAVTISGLAVADDSSLPRGVISGHPLRLEDPGAEVLLTATGQETEFWARLGPAQLRSISTGAALRDELVAWGIPTVRVPTIADWYLSRSSSPDEARQALLTDWIFHLPQARSARHASRGWLAIVEVPGLERTGHFDDTPHFFGTATGATPEQSRWGARYRHLVAQFAATGECDWPRVSGDTVPVRHLGECVRTDQLNEMVALWDGIDRP